MKISTLNIDWGKKYKSKSHIHKIEAKLVEIDSDILIVTESITSLQLPNYNYVYQTKQIPKNKIFETFDYSKYLNDEIAVRVAIYSKYESSQIFKVSDEFTSICNEFKTEKGTITIYATIIGTLYNQKPFAKNELNNCITDCLGISNLTDNLCLAGDLNTSFITEEKYFEIKSIKSRAALIDLCEKCKIDLTTKDISENIDHILLPKKITEQYNTNAFTFVKKDILSDHMGVTVEVL